MSRDHAEALKETGFWGRQAAGCLILAHTTGRLLIAHRSHHCQQPNTWGTWGGAVDAGERPEDAVRRELHEEAGFRGDAELTPLYVFRHESGFRYHNYLVTVAAEFMPALNWETQAFGWFAVGDWPDPAHFGLTALLSDAESLQIIRRAARAGDSPDTA